MNGYNSNLNTSDNRNFYDNQNNFQYLQQQQQQQQQQQYLLQTINAQYPIHPAPPGLTYVQGGMYSSGHGGYGHINYPQSQGPHMIGQQQNQHLMGSSHMSGGSQHFSQQGSGYMAQGSSHMSLSANHMQGQCSQNPSQQQNINGMRYGNEEKMIASEDEKAPNGSGTEDFLVEHLELNIFKYQQCPNSNIQHNHKQCQYYHGLKDRRRVGITYSSEQCSNIDSFGASCPFGDKCPKSHNKVEQLYCADKYKTKFCTHYPGDCRQCEYGEFCSFAHNESDIKAELIHNYEFDVDFYVFRYKTVWCPFNYINHDRGMCVYAHNWQDYRRKPNSSEAFYEPESCQSWDPNSFITEYELGCPNKQLCNKCHGWKELEYHPMVYRTKPCMQQPCPKARACPYYHCQSEKRSFPQKNGMFNSAQSQQSTKSSGQNQNESQNGGMAQGSSQYKNQSMTNKKGRMGSSIPKINTYIEQLQKQEDTAEGELNQSKGKSKKEEDNSKTGSENQGQQSHSPKKPSQLSSGNSRIQFKRCESQSGSSSNESSPKRSVTPIQQNTSMQSISSSQKAQNQGGTEELKKSLKMATPFFLDAEVPEQLQKRSVISNFENQRASPSLTIKKERNQTEEEGANNDNSPVPFNQFNSAFSMSPSTNNEQNGFNQGQHIIFQQQQQQFNQLQVNVFSPDQSTNSSQNKNCSNNFIIKSNGNNTNQRKDEQDEEDFQEISAMIDNIL